MVNNNFKKIILLFLYSFLCLGILGCAMNLGKFNLRADEAKRIGHENLNSAELKPSVSPLISEHSVDHSTEIHLVMPSPTPGATQQPSQKSVTKSAINSQIKGIYVSAWSMNGVKYNNLLKLLETTDLNAMVIDLKNDSGQVTYPSKIPLVAEIGANSKVIIPDLKDKLDQLKNKHIYTIARIVAFKDPYLSNRKSDYAIHDSSGKVWRDNKGIAWVDPYKEKVWNYNLEIAKEAVELGFDEVQFDYVRFPENEKIVNRQARFDNPKGWTKAQSIEAFLKKAKEQVGESVHISADVFGLTTSSNDDMGIGQEWARINKYVDTISPMLYPSHYSSGIYGIKNPDLQPYAIIGKAVADAKIKNEQLQHANQHTAAIRPWYQDFTATWVKPHKKYGLLEVKEQIKAAKEQGIGDFLLWNSNCVYSYQ
jgi:hypothetical protein